jgi:serine/threonine protein phosphatase PrpC
VVSAEPDVDKFEITKDDEWIVMASDGLWDLVAINDVEFILKNSQNAEEAQKKLIEAASNVEGGNDDDVSVIVVELKK